MKKKASIIEKQFVTLPLSLITRPSLIIGEGGSGKTETALKIASLLAQVYGFDVLYIDAKGDDELIPRFVAAMQQAGKQKIKVFPISPYYGWVGDARTLYNRLMAVQTFSESYYESIASLMLDLAVSIPGGPPRSSRELLRNLTLDQLKLAYRGMQDEQDELERIKPEDANGVYNRYRAFFRGVHGTLDSGFTIDETDAAYIKLDTIAFAKEAGSIGRYLMEDIAHYITVRKPKGKRVLILIDEVSALAIESIANLAERLRSFGGVVMLACQSEEGLAKSQDERNRILKTSHLLILHTSNAPEKLIERAGTYKAIATGWNTHDEEGTGFGTVRMTDEYLVPPDEVRRLEVGECFVIAQGTAYKTHVSPVRLDDASLVSARALLQQETQDAHPTTKAPDPQEITATYPPMVVQSSATSTAQDDRHEPDRL
jgi:hypothetical protein